MIRTPLPLSRVVKQFIVPAAAIFLASNVSATILTEWNFEGRPGSDDQLAATGGDNANFNLPASLITRSSLVPATDSMGDTFWATGWAGAEDPDAYFEFTIKPRSGAQYNITDLDITPVYAVPGPNTFTLYSSQDGFATALDPDAVNFLGLTSDVVFHIHIFGNEGTDGGVRYIGINGLVTHPADPVSVPETFPIWSAGLVFAGLMIARRRTSACA